MANPMTQANRDGWSAVAKIHYETYHVDRLLAGEPLLDDVIRSEVGDVQGKSLIHLLCHIGTDTLSWKLLGADVTGVDISPEAIKHARALAERLGVQATFIEADVMELADKITTTYDIVFASIGVLCWIPNIDRFAQLVRQLLKPGGFFYILDGHPFRSALEKNDRGELVAKNNYFHNGPWEYPNFGDYIVADWKYPAKSYEWTWRLGQVVTALCDARLRLAFLHEFPHYFYGGYTGYDEDTETRQLYPCTFSLKAIAEPDLLTDSQP